MITKDQLHELYERVRAGLPNAKNLSDLDILRLVCEEDSRQPFDLEWWNAEYVHLRQAALAVKTAWELAQERNAQNPLVNFGKEDEGKPNQYDEEDIPM